jgi:hypothetical protein
MRSLAYSNQAANGRRSPTARGEVEQQFKEITSTPPISKHHSSTNLDFPRRKRHRSNRYESAAFPRIDRRSSAGPALSNLDSLKTDASILANFELSNVPENTFILATPNQVSMAIEHTAVKRPIAVSMSRNNSTSTNSRVHSNDGILQENRHRSISGMFRPVHESSPEGGWSQEECSPVRYGLKLKPKKLLVYGDLFK